MRLSATRQGAISQNRGLGNPLWDVAGLPPSLDLRFAETKSLVDAFTGRDLITYTRVGDRSVITPAGGMELVTPNVPAFTHNPFTLESLGFSVEETRPNLLANSAAPGNQSFAVAAQAYTLSFYGSGDIVLTGAHSATLIGAGAFPNRATLTFTPTAGTLNVTVSGTVEFANIEPGTFATSWIPTASASATRSADVANITGTNFSSWYNQSEGTMLINYLLTRQNATPGLGLFSVHDGTASNWNRLFARASGATGYSIVTAGAGQVDLSPTGVIAANTVTALAASYATNNVAATGQGLAVQLDTSATMPSGINRAEIGGGLFDSIMNGTISRLTYWPQALLSRLQAITS